LARGWFVRHGSFAGAASLTSLTVTLTDAGSSATIDLLSGAGMNNWSVLGQNQLMQQCFGTGLTTVFAQR